LAPGFDLLSEPIRTSLNELGLETPTDIQTEAFEPILEGRHVLLIAPTGTGKTEAAVLPILDMLIQQKQRKGISLLYITPLRALNRDMLRRLRFWADRLSIGLDVRHGDTPPSQRRRQSSHPPDILVTTPETLQAMLPSRAMRRHLESVRWVVVDEVHSLAESKRGAQLTVALERLREVTGYEFQRIGLSATIGSPEIVAGFLCGAGRETVTIQVETPKEYDYRVVWPSPGEEARRASEQLYTSPEAAARILFMKGLVDSHTSTLIFVNSRQHAEMLGLRFNMLDKRIGVHHGSLSREERQRVEDEFKGGSLKAIICTSTLELGIDVGTVDLVLQYLSPRQVISLIQRVGRSGHRIGRRSFGTVVCASTDDFVEALAGVMAAKGGFMEPVVPHENSLDVLAHQCAGLAIDFGSVEKDFAFEVLRRSYSFRALPREDLDLVLDYMQGMRKLRVSGDRVSALPATRLYYYENLSTIPDERRYPIIDVSSESFVGTLGDEFVSTKARVGLKFIVRGMVWMIEQLSQDGDVYVVPVADPMAAIPGWEGELLPVSYDLAVRVGGIRREAVALLSNRAAEDVTAALSEELATEAHGIRRFVEEVAEQMAIGAPVPSDRLVLVEGFGPYMIINCCFGELVNRAILFAINDRLIEFGLSVRAWNDGYRILVEFPSTLSGEALTRYAKAIFSQSPQAAEAAFRRYLATRFPLSYNLKFVAERFGAIQRGLMLSEKELSELSLRFSGTPIFTETIREALTEKVDLANMRKIYEGIQSGEIVVATHVSAEAPTPISRHILTKFIEFPELMAPRTLEWDSAKRLKGKILSSHVHMLCMNCGATMYKSRLADLPDRLACLKCSARVIHVSGRPNSDLRKILIKHLRKSRLTEKEKATLMDAGRNADLVLTHGKEAVKALMVFGVGPQVASRLLRRRYDHEDDFFRDLLEAKLTFLRTRPFWPSSAETRRSR